MKTQIAGTVDNDLRFDRLLEYEAPKLLLPGKIKNQNNKLIWAPRFLFALSVVTLLAGVTISLQNWRSNHAAIEVAKKEIIAANEGRPSPAPSTNKITPNLLASYTVPPNMPRYLLIPKLSVDARILPVGLTTSGSIGTPSNVADTDWFNQSSLPGQQGAMLIDGHVSSWTTNGVFYGIKNLVPGDIIKVVRGDGTIFSYKVVKSQVYSSTNVDMSAALAPVLSGVPGLNLISCTGDVIAGTNNFNQRIVVFAEQI
jgi:sortase (surface protein transpeptidase)